MHQVRQHQNRHPTGLRGRKVLQEHAAIDSPIHRLIQERIKRELAEEILFGELAARGGIARVRVHDNGLKVTCEAAAGRGAASRADLKGREVENVP